MAKILIKPQHKAFWFERLSAISYYTETQFEERLLNQSSYLFKDYWVIPFKKEISHLSDAKQKTKPDLVFIKKDYSTWILIEVELDNHNYEHVKSQVEVMKKPNFNAPDLVRYITSKEGHVFEKSFKFEQSKLTKLISNVNPEVLVIVDETKIDWEQPLKKIGVSLCVVQVYKNGEQEEIFRLKGQYPKTFTGVVHCRKSKYPANSVEIINYEEMLSSFVSGDDIEIYYKDILTKWNILITRTKKCFLKCVGPIYPLPVNREFVLKMDSDKKLYYFEQN